jgi:NAD(P)-dependent dehydrogenase (short-subunit alcohol dehydrogenase family)
MVHAREGIRFNALCPWVKWSGAGIALTSHRGPLRTPMLMEYLNTPEKLNRRLVHAPMGRFGEAVEQAKPVVFRE